MIQETLQSAEEQMDRTIEATREDFASVRTGRANPGLYSKVMVDYYGSFTPLQQLASFQTPEARVMLITPFDKGAMSDIEKALREAKVFTAWIDGDETYEEQVLGLARRPGDDLLVRADKTQAAQRLERGPRLGRQHRLAHPQPRHEAHLLQPLQGRGARVAHLAPMEGGGQVAGRQAAVIVGRAHESIEVVFAHGVWRRVWSVLP